MQFTMNENSLFAVLLRSRWWVSFAIAIAFAGTAVALLPPAYAFAGYLMGAPFVVIGCMAAWRQWQAPSRRASRRPSTAVRAMSWSDFARALPGGVPARRLRGAAGRGSGADFEIRKEWRRALVSGKRWKVARTGVEPLARSPRGEGSERSARLHVRRDRRSLRQRARVRRQARDRAGRRPRARAPPAARQAWSQGRLMTAAAACREVLFDLVRAREGDLARRRIEIALVAVAPAARRGDVEVVSAQAAASSSPATSSRKREQRCRCASCLRRGPRRRSRRQRHARSAAFAPAPPARPRPRGASRRRRRRPPRP